MKWAKLARIVGVLATLISIFATSPVEAQSRSDVTVPLPPLTKIELDRLGNVVRVSQIGFSKENKPIVVSVLASAQVSTNQVISTQIGFLVGHSASSDQDFIDFLNQVNGGVQVSFEFGLHGYEIAGGVGGLVGKLALVSGFAGIEIYRPYSSRTPFFGLSGETYIGPRGEISIAGMKATLAFLMKATSGFGADVIGKISLGVGF